MPDRHDLPLKGRDLPGVAPLARPARVHRSPRCDDWMWLHQCTRTGALSGFGFPSPGAAADAARRHVRRCPGW